MSSVEHFDVLGTNCTAQPMYVLKPTCSCCRTSCGSDDDAHTNTGRESPLRCKWSTPRTCFDRAIPGGQLLWTQHNHATCSVRETVLGTIFGAFLKTLAVASRALAIISLCDAVHLPSKPWLTNCGSFTLTLALLSWTDHVVSPRVPRRILSHDGVCRVHQDLMFLRSGRVARTQALSAWEDLRDALGEITRPLISPNFRVELRRKGTPRGYICWR